MKHAMFALSLIPVAALAAGGSPDASFYKTLARGGIAEVRLGKLAERKSADPNVKEFAAMMVKDHSAANAQLRTLAASKNVALPRGPGMSADAKKTGLEVLSGHAFDSSYLSSQIKA